MKKIKFISLNIQKFSSNTSQLTTSVEAGKTIQINGSATLTDVDASKNSRVTKLLGQTSQTTYTGKNLLNLNSFQAQTKNGITFTPVFENNQLKYININGTATDNSVVNLVNYTTTTNNVLNGCYGGSSSTYKIDFQTDGGQLSPVYNGESISLPNTTSGKIRIVVYSGKTVSNVKLYPMIRLSSASDTYEPYVGGVPSPNPDFPEPVNVVSGDNTINICGKNLCPNDFTNGVFNNNTGVIQSHDNNHISYENYIKVSPSTQYYIKNNHNFGGTGSTSIFEYDKNKNFIQRQGFTSKNSTPFTTSNETQYVNISVFDNSGASLSGFECQLEVGSTATTYEPYIGSSYPISLGDIELCKIGSYQDSIYKGKGYNLFDKDDTNASRGYFLNSNGVETTGTNWGVYYVPIQPNTTYTISGCQTNGGVNFCWFDSNKTFISNIGQKQNRTITSPSNAKYLGLSVVWNTTSSAYDSQLMVNEGTTALPYEPYNAKDKWLLHKEIGKVVLNGSESWQDRPSYNTCDRFVEPTIISTKQAIQNIGLSNYFEVKSVSTTSYPYITPNGTQIVCNYSEKGTTTLAQFKTWLSTHNTIVYYVLAEPTTELITDETLLAQLDDLESS